MALRSSLSGLLPHFSSSPVKLDSVEKGTLRLLENLTIVVVVVVVLLMNETMNFLRDELLTALQDAVKVLLVRRRRHRRDLNGQGGASGHCVSIQVLHHRHHHYECVKATAYFSSSDVILCLLSFCCVEINVLASCLVRNVCRRFRLRKNTTIPGN